MVKILQIVLIAHIFFAGSVLVAQEELTAEVTQDDLGNVTDEFQEYFFEALKQKGIENHEKAITALEKCIEIDPKPVVYFEMGKNYNALKRFSEAATFLEKARQLSPGTEAILVELYDTYYLSKQFRKALPVVEELQQMNEIFSEDLANLYLLNEKFEKALSLLDQLDAQWGESDYREGLRRQIYNRTGNVSAGLENIKKRIAENPEEQENYLNLIFLYSEMGQEELAIQTAYESLERFPDSDILHLALYKYYLDKNESEKAVSSIKIILKGSNINEDAKYQVMNDFLLFVEEHPELEKELMEITELFAREKGNVQVFSELGGFFLRKNQREKALEYFQQGMAYGQLNFETLVKTLLLQLEFGKIKEAKALSSRSLEEYPSQPILYLIRGTVFNQTREFKDAKQILKIGLDYLIGNDQMEADFYEQLAITYRGLNEEASAQDYDKLAEKLKQNTGNE